MNGEGIVPDRNVQMAEASLLQRQFGFNFVAMELFGQKLGIDLSTDQFRPEFDSNLNAHIDARDMNAIIFNNDSGSPVSTQATLMPVENGAASDGVGEAEPTVIIKLSDLSFSVYQNPDQRADVNADKLVTPLDALLVINTLNHDGPRSLDVTLGGSNTAEGENEPSALIAPPFFDVSGDNMITPLDVLVVINNLNTNGARQAGSISVGGEGESLMGDELASLPMVVDVIASPNAGPGLAAATVPRFIASDGGSSGEGTSDRAYPLVKPSADPLHLEVFGDESHLGDSLDPEAGLLDMLAEDVAEVWTT